MASAKGASENFKVFCRTAAYDVIFFQIPRGGGSAPLTPLRAPMPTQQIVFVGFYKGASFIDFYCDVSHVTICFLQNNSGSQWEPIPGCTHDSP